MYLAEHRHSLRKLKGVGVQTARLLARLGVKTILDLLLFLPRSYEDRTRLVGFQEAVQTALPAYTTAKVLSWGFFGTRRSFLKLRVRDHLGTEASLLCFNREYLKDRFPPGSSFHLRGLAQIQYGEIQLANFQVSPCSSPEEKPPGFGSWNPIYPSTAGLAQNTIHRLVEQALRWIGPLDEEIPFPIRSRHALLTWNEALERVHRPKTRQDYLVARRTLAWKELWFLIGTLLLDRRIRQRIVLPSGALPRTLLQRALEHLPFRLTFDQERALEAILNDLESGRCMARLLQGEVGSGKTLVSFLSALPLIESGKQVAFLAPTELLARQHYLNALRYLSQLGVRSALITGSLADGARSEVLTAIDRGEVSLVFGTHALLSPNIPWKDLAYVIVDEQHRFGVEQREALLHVEHPRHLLMMSATPIPRSLALTVYGDLDITEMRALPQGRSPITTYLCRMDHEERVWSFLEPKIRQGQQAYVVVPLIEESEKRDLRSLFEIHRRVQDRFPQWPVGLVHGRLKESEKIRVMEDFHSGKVPLLCATSVIEVGVDVPNATCMVIFHAEVFGLAALHQLRGRVGRGTLPGYCFLVYGPHLTEEAKERLKILRQTTDGFTLAEKDLSLRGPGEFLGVRQSGFTKLRVADLTKDASLLASVRDELLHLLERDPEGSWISALRAGSILPKDEEEPDEPW